MRYRILLSMTSLLVSIVFSTTAYGHGDEKHKKPEKVSSVMAQEKAPDAAHPETGHEGIAKSAQDTVTERDFNTIRAGVKSSTTSIVIKVLALAIAIVGLGVVYLPRKTGGSS